MPFWKKNLEEEKSEPVQKNFVVKLKQDRYKNWIMEALIQAVIEKTNEVNGDE